MSKGLRTTFLLHAIVALAFGIVLYFVPAWFGNLVRWSPIDPVMTSFFAAGLLALGASSVLGYTAEHWEDVRIVVMMECVFSVTAMLAALYYLLFAGAPAFAWVPALIWLAFSFAFIYEYVASARSHPHMAGVH